jgi:hypothetical protein
MKAAPFAKWYQRSTRYADFLDLLVFDGEGYRLYTFPLWQLPATEVRYARCNLRPV